MQVRRAEHVDLLKAIRDNTRINEGWHDGKYPFAMPGVYKAY